MPFDSMPIEGQAISTLLSPPYGATSFAFERHLEEDETDRIYRFTHGVHPGIDYGGLQGSCDESPLGGEYFCREPVVAMCNGIIVDGRISRGAGGSGAGGTAYLGWGVSQRCFVDDREGDGTPNLSNVIIVYNHLLIEPMVNLGDIVTIGQRLGITGGDSQYDHLHLEIYLARGFLSSGLYININPLLMYTTDLISSHTSNQTGHRFRRYYPVTWSRNPADEEIPGLDWERINESGALVCRSVCMGILRGDLGLFSQLADDPREGGFQNFWRTQDVVQTGIEWPPSLFVADKLITQLNDEYLIGTENDAPDPFEYPNCISNQGVLTCPNTDLTQPVP
jgi:hypothetical protein